MIWVCQSQLSAQHTVKDFWQVHNNNQLILKTQLYLLQIFHYENRAGAGNLLKFCAFLKMP